MGTLAFTTLRDMQMVVAASALNKGLEVSLKIGIIHRCYYQVN